MQPYPRRSPALAALLFLILASPAVAREWTWTGPWGGEVHSLYLEPKGRTLYAGTAAGVFVSPDGGATWLPPPPGSWPALESPALHLAVDSRHPSIVYAGIGSALLKSIDGGFTWSFTGQGMPNISALAVAPNGKVFVGTWAGLFQSGDGAATWRRAGRGIPERFITALEIDLTRPDRIYAGVSNSATNGVYRTTDGGSRWTFFGGAPLASGVIDLAVSPAAPNTVYAATGNGVARSFDGGSTWLAAQGLAGRVNTVAPSPIDPSVVYAGTPDGVFRSVDRGATWLRVSDGLTDPDVRALVIAPAAHWTLWAGTAGAGRVGGVFQTTDFGEHWTARNSGGLSSLTVQALELDPHTPGTLFAALGSKGLARSRDRGFHWTVLPLPSGTNVTDVEVDPHDPSAVYAASVAGPSFLKSTDGGDTWSPSASPPPSLHTIAADPDDPGVLHGGGAGFFKSVDAGETWVRSPSLPQAAVVQIEATAGPLYAVGTLLEPGASWPYFFRSRDKGATWEPLLIDPAARPNRLTVSPSDPRTVYVISNNNEIFRTTDGGDTWEYINQLYRLASLAIAPGFPETIYAFVNGEGVHFSTNGGTNFFSDSTLKPFYFSGESAVDPHDPSRVYAAVSGRGLAMLFQPENCEAGPTVICLQGGRFRVEAGWQDHQGNIGLGQAYPMTDETGGFWFFSPGNVELVVKVLDVGNDDFWVFAASLTNVEFTLTVTDTETGRQRIYRNPAGRMASFGDTNAF